MAAPNRFELAVVEAAAVQRRSYVGLRGLGSVSARGARELLLSALSTTSFLPDHRLYQRAQALASDYGARPSASALDAAEESVVMDLVARLNPPWYARTTWVDGYDGAETPLTNGAIVGLGLGAAALVVGGVWYWRRKR